MSTLGQFHRRDLAADASAPAPATAAATSSRSSIETATWIAGDRSSGLRGPARLVVGAEVVLERRGSARQNDPEQPHRFLEHADLDRPQYR
jgi:hypothetical protein